MNRLTAGSLIWLPMPAGTVTGAPLTKTSRCACTCRKTNSCVSGVSPARTVSFIGFAGAGHGAAPLAGVGAEGAAVVVVAVLVALPPPQPAARSRTRNGTKRLIRGTLSAVPWTGPTRRSEMTELATPPVERDQDVKRISHWIGGRVVEGQSGRNGPVYNPALGRQTGEVDFATRDEIDLAVQTAREAFPAWRAMSLSKRTALFFSIRELFDHHREDIARLLTAEHGKVLSDALGEVARGLEVIEYCCGIPELLKGSYSGQASTGVDVYSIRQPLGVVGGITPFNFPAMVPMWMWAPALACGNTFVLKPSEKDPSASVYLAQLMHEAGVPDGVFNVVHGDKVAVDALLEHPDVSAISFVGSTPVAKYVYERATAAGKRVQALGGAKNHAVVMPDADLDFAANHLTAAGYGSAGQRCMAISVAVAVGDAADPLIERLEQKTLEVKVGPGLDPASEMGPVVTPQARDRIVGYIEQGAEAGAVAVVDGRGLGIEGDGFWVGP